MKRLFGTDGIRGQAGEPPLDPGGVRRFGAALGEVLREERAQPRAVLGRDTRESGPWLRDAVASGLASRGADVVDAGVITTPGLAWIVGAGGFDAAVMISASHNPYLDNGLKVFGGNGIKLSDANEARIERLLLDDGRLGAVADGWHGSEDGAWRERYVDKLERVLPAGRLRGRRVVLDCGHGAATSIAPGVFAHYGAAVETIGAAPDGRNINLDCGSLHLAGLAGEVQRRGASLGIAFDGDADRALAVDRRGRTVEGDHVLYLTARRLHRLGRLRGSAVVATIMSNYWLERRLAAEGIRLHRAPVGDKYVLETMLEHDLVLGGEQSGHVIFREHATTGDGILTGLLLLDTLAEESESLEQILDGIVPLPQVLLAVRVGAKPDLRVHPRIGPLLSDIEAELVGTGRVVLRYSGTEPVARVMVEGEDETTVRRHAERLAATIREELGA
ncbi:MAG TPA: phosphoglucosamine mutase [Candidatus Polarisedimenticolaceae bacterium]|nr:phosphoglucosamine mutase [Candidatus Polarisedimenticolaceae bacterium]